MELKLYHCSYGGICYVVRAASKEEAARIVNQDRGRTVVAADNFYELVDHGDPGIVLSYTE